MRSEASGSNSGVTDETSLHTALYYSLGYSNNLVQNQNQLIPVFPSLQTVYDAPLHAPPPPPVSYYPSETTTPHMNYGYGSIPSDASFFNKFIASQNGVEGNLNSGNWVSLSHAAASDVNGNSIQEQCSEMSSSSNALSCSNSYKPLHLSQLLSGSSFLQAMQEILAEIACFALENLEHVNDSATGNDRNRVPLPVSSENVVMFGTIGRDVEAKKKRLLALLQVVDDQYSQCLDEIHTVISAFHAVTELDPNLHSRFALPAISMMYKNLREKISSHILAMGSHHSHGGEVQSKEDHCSLDTSFIQKQWALQQLRKKDHPLWRPQRGLPERSVAVLRAWMFQNFLHPYPKDAEKHILAMKSGLTRSQVSNWFINARVRLWKPMIEEMYAEMNRRKARINANDEEEAHGSNRIPVRSNHARFMDS